MVKLINRVQVAIAVVTSVAAVVVAVTTGGWLAAACGFMAFTNWMLCD